MSDPVLDVKHLSVDYVSAKGLVHVVDDVSLELRRGEVHGLVGESGCGKSTLARSLLRVLGPPAIVSGGSVMLEGRDVMTMSAHELDLVRWVRMAIVFQGAIDALNPVLRIQEQLIDALTAHGVRDGLEDRAKKLVDRVSLPRRVLTAFPHELSGGMRQRVVIAMALALGPQVLLMDEPTTALDVVVQAEILDELDRLRKDMGFAVLLVSHDLPLMLERCDRISVMYAGRIIESGPVASFRDGGPSSHPYAKHLLGHPYAQHLLHSFPRLDGPRTIARALEGSPPSLFSPPPGCRFHPRCPMVMPICKVEQPKLTQRGVDHVAACHLEHSAEDSRAVVEGPPANLA
ncbi:MAG: ABC transporter ATP-binding protein [Myxococcales bacterium]|nr:ABC transporter ATP-binding protein [Myxococcales bacterium]